MFEFAMPSLGADMESGTILDWYVKPGDVVKRGAIVGLVDTEKAEIEIEIWTPGRVEQVLVEPGREVSVGTALLRLSEVGAAASVVPPAGGVKPSVAAPPSAPPIAARTAPPDATPSRVPSPRVGAAASSPDARPPRMTGPASKTPRVDTTAPVTGRERVRATPLARRIARERSIDLASLKGSGPQGRIRAEDVRATAAPASAVDTATRGRTTPASAPSRSVDEPLSSERLAAIQRGMAAAMVRSKREIPHFYLALDVDMTRALAWLEAENRRRSVEERLLLQVLLLKATARALVDVPDLNGHWLEDRFVPATAVHLGVAITVRGGGLLAPALHDVDRRDLDALMHDLSDLVTRARRAQLRSSEVRDATATVTSLADRGPDRVYGVIYPPQVALVGFGGVRERPWAEAGMLGVRPVLTITLSADHRASDGQRGTRLLRRIARALDDPEKLA